MKIKPIFPLAAILGAVVGHAMVTSSSPTSSTSSGTSSSGSTTGSTSGTTSPTSPTTTSPTAPTTTTYMADQCVPNGLPAERVCVGPKPPACSMLGAVVGGGTINMMSASNPTVVVKAIPMVSCTYTTGSTTQIFNQALCFRSTCPAGFTDLGAIPAEARKSTSVMQASRSGMLAPS